MVDRHSALASLTVPRPSEGAAQKAVTSNPSVRSEPCELTVSLK